MEANRFGFAMAGSHSSRTAEGDNAVLMNKVASELIQAEGKNAKSLIGKYFIGQQLMGVRMALFGLLSQASPDLKGLVDVMHKFYEFNMAKLMMEMQKNAKAHGRVSAWMEHSQNNVQSTARAYGEWTIARDALARIAEYSGDNETMKTVMDELLLLYIVDSIKKSAEGYVSYNCIGKFGLMKLNEKHIALCKSIGDNSVNLTDSFGLSDSMLATPCALDWIDYNSYDNQGEVVSFLKKLRREKAAPAQGE